MTLAPIDPYPVELQHPSATADDVQAAYLGVVTDAIVNHPRTLQRRIGPSELGNDCTRRIGYKLAGAPDFNPAPDVPWLPTIGTGVHGWLDDAFTAANTGLTKARWLSELRVCVGQVGPTNVTGSLDLFDRATGTVIDHKIVGPTTLKKYRSSGPGQQYRSQVHLYGKGARDRRLDVRRVMIAFLPRNAELNQAYYWSEAYDEAVADTALARANGIHTTLQQLGPARALPLLPTAEAYCRRCPFYRRGSTDLMTGCPGDPAMGATTSPPALSLSR